VAGYTVAYDKDGVPWRGILVADLPSGSRAYAHVTREELMADAVSRELVGQRVELTTDGKVNVASW
jgi:acetyl-CoA C-acetyltransferase